MKRSLRHRLVLSCLWTLAIPVGGTAVRAGEGLDVAAASSLAEALEELARAWEGSPGGGPVRLNLGASNALARQLAHGAPADVFVSADAAQMDRVEAAGALLAGSRVDLLTNRLAAVVPAGSRLRLAGPRDLLQPAVRRLAMGDPEAVPAGVYGRFWLERLGLWAGLRRRAVAAESVRGALAAVASGDADAGLVYRSDAVAEPRVRVAFLAAGAEAPRIVYPAAVLAASRQAEAARRFVAFLQAPPARAVFVRRGFGVVGAAE